MPAHADLLVKLPHVEQYTRWIDQALLELTDFDADCPDKLREAIRYMVLAPGKRIRPLLVMYAAEACSGESCSGQATAAVRAAAAVEMLHTYSLIHDDLPCMDDDELRRGQPTCHRRYDEATAILAGDALQCRAFEVLAGLPSDQAARSVATLAAAAGASNLVGGQVDDLEQLPDREAAPTADFLERIHRRKTAALISAAVQIGGIVAGGGPQPIRKLADYGLNLGLAFQIVDDLLDFAGDGFKMGKQTGVDRRNGTLTYPALLGEAASRVRAEALIGRAVAALEALGPPAQPLRDLANFVLHRDF